MRILRERVNGVYSTLMSTFWFVPTVIVLIMTGAAAGFLNMDQHLNARDLVTTFPFLYTGGVQSTRSILSSIGSSMITVAGTTFSITIAALTLASSNFGPRLLRNFMNDRGNQVVLGVFVATFWYCLLIQRAVRDIKDLPDIESVRVVPHISTTFALALAAVNIGVLIYFIHHITSSIQISTLLEDVRVDVQNTVDHIFPQRIGYEEDEAPNHGEEEHFVNEPDFENIGARVLSDYSGYVQLVDEETLLEAAQKHDVQLKVIYKPGDFVVRGNTLLYGYPPARLTDDACKDLRKGFALGKQRTLRQDIEFGLLQLVEVAVRALSPSTNDPYTAVNALYQLSVVLCDLTERKFPARQRYDENGALRVVVEPVQFHDLLDVAFDQIRNNGGEFVSVLEAMLRAIRAVGERTSYAETCAELRRHAQLVHECGQQHLPDDTARTKLDGAMRQTLELLARREIELSPPNGEGESDEDEE